MIKRIRYTINTLLSALIVALGFGSCVSQKTYEAAKQEIKQLQEENEMLKNDNSTLSNDVKRLKKSIAEYQKRMEQRKVVYGPRPTDYKKNINNKE